MSYSFSFRAPDKESAVRTLGEKFDEVEKQQPVHIVDRWQAFEAAVKFVMMASDPDPAKNELYVAVNGSVWQDGDVNAGVKQVSVSISVSLMDKQA